MIISARNSVVRLIVDDQNLARSTGLTTKRVSLRDRLTTGAQGYCGWIYSKEASCCEMMVLMMVLMRRLWIRARIVAVSISHR